jgi:aldose 1-epimerase
MLEVDLLPEVGGSIVRFERIEGDHRQPLLRGTGETIASVLDTGCFPLVPFANRIRGGCFLCDGRKIVLAPNMAGDASPLHGQGWLAAWEMKAHGASAATLSYSHHAGEWPWSYEARQEIALDPGGLSLTLSCRNLSAERMPCGLGFHPYYPCDGQTLLDTNVASAWTVDAAVLPVANVPATGRYDLRDRRICGQGLDNGYEGWGGSATMRWPDQRAGLRLSSPDAGRFQVYSPAEGGLFVAEPVQNANAALNEPQARWPDLGIMLLERGEEAVLHARFDVVVG